MVLANIRHVRCSDVTDVHTTTGYLLLTKGDASFARSGACVMIRAIENQPEFLGVYRTPRLLPAGRVDEKVLD